MSATFIAGPGWPCTESCVICSVNFCCPFGILYIPKVPYAPNNNGDLLQARWSISLGVNFVTAWVGRISKNFLELLMSIFREFP